MSPTNQEIARKLRDHATELARQGDNLYRVRAFRQAAIAILALPEELATLTHNSGNAALERLPGVGKSLASTIAKFLNTSDTSGTVAA